MGWGLDSRAQSGHFSAASLGMGGTGTAFMDGYHANFRNPANLMLDDGDSPAVSVGILGGLTAVTGGPLMNISVYNRHFTSGQTVDADKALNEWFGSDPAASRRMGMELNVVPLGVSWRGDNIAFSLALRNRVLLSTELNRGYAEVILAGVSQERFGEPKAVNFSSEAVMFSEVSVGTSIKILEFPSLAGIGKNVKVFAGVAPKYIIPNHTSSFGLNSTLQITSSEVVHDFRYTLQTVGSLTDQFREYREASRADNFDGALGDFVDPQGSDFTEIRGHGFGVDLGGTVQMDLAGPLGAFFSWIKGPKKLSVGISLTDLGSVSYTDKAGSFTAEDTFVWDGVDFEDGFDDALADSISQDIYLNYEPGDKEEISRKLPTKLNLGGHLQLGKLSLALDLGKGLNESGMNSRRLSMGFGVEYALFNFLPLRAGYRTGGLTSSSLSVGTGLDFRNFELTVGALAVPDSENNGSGLGGAWSGLLIRF